MGESIVDASNHEDKMGETGTARSNPVLDVSVSFGRFENDSLSWERWSSFSPNKYLEEVEKCATPGSVAKKAAYFEAHYKKIAARKAELLDQEKQMDDDPPRSNGPTRGDLIVENGRTQLKSDTSDCQSSTEVVNHETSFGNELSGILENEPNTDAASMVECQSSSIERNTVGAESRLEGPTLDKPEEVVHVMVKEEAKNASMSMKDMKELHEKEIKNTTNVKLDLSKESHKIPLMNKETNITRTNKKPASPVAKASPFANGSPVAKASPITKASPLAKTLPITKGPPLNKASPVAKAPQNSAPRVSKPTSSFTPVSSSRSSTRIGNNSSLQRTKNPSAGESKKLAPKTLHMSLSLGPSIPSSPSSSGPPSLTITRKSLIMEKMGDKDIVKRAFKTFQNSYNQSKSAGEKQSPASKQVPTKVGEPRVSTLMTPQKENGRLFKTDGVEKKHGKASPSSLAMKSDERAEKRREKLEEKSNARQVQRNRHQTKSKEDREENKKVRHGLNSKTTSMPGIYRGQKNIKTLYR